MRSTLITAALLAATTTACLSVDQASLRDHLLTQGLAVTVNDPPEGATPLTVVTVHQTGFYLFGTIAVAPVSLQDCLHELAGLAMDAGADGVSNLEVISEPAAFWKFAIFPIPDWSSSISLTGMSYRLPTPAEKPAAPNSR